MDDTAASSDRNMPHGLRGPHSRSQFSPELRAELLRWLEETEDDVDLSLREVAQFLSLYPPLEQAVRGMVGSAPFGGMEPSSTTHALAMLGMRSTRWLLRTIVETSPNGTRSFTSS